MTDRERFVNCVLGRDVDRPPFWLFWSPWGRALPLRLRSGQALGYPVPALRASPKSSAFSRLSTQEVVRTDSEAVG